MISEVKKADELRCKVKERAALLSKSVKQAKNLGVDITANAPIEGKNVLVIPITNSFRTK